MRDPRPLKVGLALLDMHGRNRHDPRVAQELEERWGLKIVNSNSVRFNQHDHRANYDIIQHIVERQLPEGQHYCYLNKMLVVVDFDWEDHVVVMWSYDGNYTGVMELAPII